MSKSSPIPPSSYDRIPTYEESVASPSQRASYATAEKGSSNTPFSTVNSMIRTERTRRVTRLVQDSIIPKLATQVTDGHSQLTFLVIPSDNVPNSAPSTYTDPYASPKPALSASNIVSPTLPATVTALLPLSGEDQQSTFWLQDLAVQELGHTLLSELVGSAGYEPDSKEPSIPLPSYTPISAPLPDRPPRKSWLKRTLQLPDTKLPGPDHDPTGETGKWDLGWRSPPEGSTRSEWGGRGDDVGVKVRVQNVSFRTENEMGLWESRTAACLWLEVNFTP